MLPITPLVPELVDKIVANDCILVAPPGAGKSTYLPLKLLNIPAFANKMIIMLQPRQVAVRGIAQYLSAQLGHPLGTIIGYQMRGESNYSTNTKLLIMTEGLLSARIQHNPELTDVALIIFDEFHERSVFSDIALGLSIEVQQSLREDLRLLVMSATLDIKPIQALLNSPLVFQSEGRGYPIGYYYRPQITQTKTLNQHNKKVQLTQHIAKVVSEALVSHKGHVLVFMPGVSEINRLIQELENRLTHNGEANIYRIYPLYGGLSSKAQQQAIDPPQNGKRKIVIATNIAETSLTIDGVSIVIDSGLEKVQTFNLARKASQLSEQIISKASTIQRAGRAGRQQAGVCYRLWSEQQQQFLIEKSLPQITQVDISPYLLSLKEWGTSFAQLPLIDKPSDAQIDYANELLTLLEFVTPRGAITSKGRQAATLNTHPRLAKLLMHTSKHADPQYWYVYALLAAILEGKPLNREADSINVQDQLLYLLGNKSHNLHKEAKRWSKAMQGLRKNSRFTVAINHLMLVSFIDSPEFRQSLLLVFPDRVAKRRKTLDNSVGDNAYILENGVGAIFPCYPNSPISKLDYEWLICLDFALNPNVGQANTKHNSSIRLFLPLSGSLIAEYIANNKQTANKLKWDNKLLKISASRADTLGAITLTEQKISLKDALAAQGNKQVRENKAQIESILFQQIKKQGIASLLEKACVLRNRIQLAREHEPIERKTLPDCSYAGLELGLQSWLGAYLQDISSWQQLLDLEWHEIIRSLLSWEQQQHLNQHYPTHFTAPTGNKHKLLYKGNGEVELGIRLQELYGLTDTPSVGQSKHAVTLSLLSPAHREIQKTKDLAGFWQGSYLQVQKEMKGRYPKHFWPDSPATSQATTRVKKHM